MKPGDPVYIRQGVCVIEAVVSDVLPYGELRVKTVRVKAGSVEMTMLDYDVYPRTARGISSLVFDLREDAASMMGAAERIEREGV